MATLAVVLAGSRRSLRLPPRTIRAFTLMSYALLLALAAVALLGRRPLVLDGQYTPPVFGAVAILAAAVAVPAAMLALRSARFAGRIVRLAQETRARSVACFVVAACFAAAWLLKTVMTDRLAGDIVGFNLPFTMNDALAVLDGRTPLVDYHGIYAKLFPYLTSVVLSTFGTTIFVYTAFMAALNGLALLAVYAVFRRVTRSSLLALGLFLPFVATSDVNCVKVVAGSVSPMALSAMWPMRYGGVYLLAWLTVRQLDDRGPRRASVAFLIAGFVAINSLEFGLAAVAATVVALLCGKPPRSRADVLQLARSVVVGMLGAVAVVCLITVVRAGALPRPALLFEWPRIFAQLGWFSLPLTLWEFHLAVYATFAAALVLAAVRVSRADDDRLLTGMLAWSGLFGLVAGSYFVGRPDALKLEAMLSPWSFTLALLTVACVRSLSARGWRRPTLPQLLVLFGFVLSISSLARFSLPPAQIARLTKSLPDPTYQASAEQFLGERTQRGETVMILIPMSYRMALDLGLRNVAPYAFMDSIVTRAQMQTVIDVVQRTGVRKVFTPMAGARLMQEGDAAPQQLQLLIDRGFKPAGSSTEGILELRKA
jgi:hypothetical protein